MARHSIPTRPWLNTYWLPGGQVLCGEYPGDKDPSKQRTKLEALAAFNVSTYIDLTTPEDPLGPYEPIALGSENLPPPGIIFIDGPLPAIREVHKLPIPDQDVPPPSRMTQILDVIDDAVARGRTVYLHCWGGVGRTGTVAGCWLRRHGCTADEALAIINQRWQSVAKVNRKPQTPETDAQRRFIIEWDERLSPSRRRFDFLDRENRVRGCLLGGAVGDALGAPVEFWSHDNIVAHYGAAGIQEMDAVYGRVGAITDDTQMTLFTAEGLLRFWVRDVFKGIASYEDVQRFAYRRWLHTQGEPVEDYIAEYPGWLIGNQALHQRRAPGGTCLEALRLENEAFYQYTNTSKGCGGVMRAAPCGLYSKIAPRHWYLFGEWSAKVTHRHPEGYVAAGVFAALIGHLRQGAEIAHAVELALGAAARRQREAPRTFLLLAQALRMADAKQKFSVKRLSSLGAGWVAEEALAIGVYAALMAEGDFARGVRYAVNHSGDSDSTGSIAGNILGVHLGAGHIPERWLAQLEARDVIEQVADDLVVGWRDRTNWFERYPGN
jgi:ADP-ribosyl-[dinitrogen reductase] hydrolase